MSGNLVAYEDGKVVGEIKGLSSPHDEGATPEGDIWLADAGNDRMLLRTPCLQIIKELSGSRYKFNGPRYQNIMPDGTLIVADKNSHTVKIIGTGWPEKGPSRFTTLEGVELRGETLWILDAGNDRIVKNRITRN